VRATRFEAGPRVVRRVAFEKDERNLPVVEKRQAAADERGPDAAPLVRGQDGQWAEHLHVDQPAGSVEQTAGEHHVADDRTAVDRDEGERRRISAQVIDQIGDRRTVVAEGRAVQWAYRMAVVVLAKLHARGPYCHRLSAAPGL
jgi:hypothetical protein